MNFDGEDIKNIDGDSLKLELKNIRDREVKILKELNRRKIDTFFSTHIPYDKSQKVISVLDKTDREHIVKDLHTLYSKYIGLFQLRDISKPHILYEILIDVDNVFFLYEYVNEEVPEWFSEKYNSYQLS